MSLLAVVARKVVVRHGQAFVVVLSQFFTLAQKGEGLVRLSLFEHLNCKHVANVADLNRRLRKLHFELHQNLLTSADCVP